MYAAKKKKQSKEVYVSLKFQFLEQVYIFSH